MIQPTIGDGKTVTNLAQIYEQDFHVWTMRNAALLRQGKIDEIDTVHLAEELVSMGRRDRHELVSRIKILIGHLLKWQFQPLYRSSSWRGSILEKRLWIRDLLAFSPSLKPFVPEAIVDAYPDAVQLAEKETGLSHGVFPKDCSYTFEQVLSSDLFPGSSKMMQG